MKHDVVGVPLWRQLQATASVVAAVRAGASGTAAVEAVGSDLRPGVQALAFHVWRNLGRAEALRDQLAKNVRQHLLMHFCAWHWHWSGKKIKRLTTHSPWLIKPWRRPSAPMV